jgi:Family of unknown function (DUF6768)
MTRFDDDVRAALRNEQDRASAATDEMTISQLQSMVLSSLSGKSRWLSIVSIGKILMFFVAAVFAAVRFFQVDTVQEWVGYAALFSVCTLGMAMISITYWNFLTRNALAKAIKQLELRIAQLTERLNRNEAA